MDGFGDSQCLVLTQTLTNHLFLSRRPIDLDAIYFCRVTQTEVERQDTLGQIAGFTVVVPGVGLTVDLQPNGRAQAIAVGLCADENDFEPGIVLCWERSLIST